MLNITDGFWNKLSVVLASLWNADTRPTGQFPLVFLITYGLKPNGEQTNGLREVVALYANRFHQPNQTVLYGFLPQSACDDPEKTENGGKRAIIEKLDPLPCIIEIGAVSSTIDEALATRAWCDQLLMAYPTRILVITGPAHSRTCRYVWRKTFPRAEINVATFDTVWEFDEQNTMVFARNRWAWLLANMLRHVAWRVLVPLFGLEKMSRLRQPTSKKRANQAAS